MESKTNAKLIVVEPTIVGEDVGAKGNHLLEDYVAIRRACSKEFGAIHVPMHARFMEYLKRDDNKRLTFDGVHMTSLGNMLMSVTWLESAFQSVIGDG